jgi:hypothetical protein
MERSACGILPPEGFITKDLALFLMPATASQHWLIF